MELTLVQMILIGVLVLIVPLGIWNQQRVKKRKKDLENFNYDNSDSNTSDFVENSIIKNYILQYKGQYGRDAIKQSLISAGNNEDEVEKHLDKYF